MDRPAHYPHLGSHNHTGTNGHHHAYKHAYTGFSNTVPNPHCSRIADIHRHTYSIEREPGNTIRTRTDHSMDRIVL